MTRASAFHSVWSFNNVERSKKYVTLNYYYDLSVKNTTQD